MRCIRSWAFALAGLLALGACRASKNGATADSSRDSAGTASMATMGDTGAARMDSMQAHMRTIETMSAEQMKAALPMHRQMVANTLAEMNRQMQQMNMPPDAKWTALADSVRRDLIALPDMSATELRNALPAHRARVIGLMEMHASMMRGMKM